MRMKEGKKPLLSFEDIKKAVDSNQETTFSEIHPLIDKRNKYSQIVLKSKKLIKSFQSKL